MTKVIEAANKALYETLSAVPNAKFTGAEGVRCNAGLDAATAKENK